MTATRESAAALSRKLKPLSAVLPKKNRKHSVADMPEFSTATAINPDFSRLTDNKTVSNKRWGSITFLEMERMESVSRSLLEGNSYSLWLMSGLLSQLKQAGFNPPDPALFNTNISSASLSSQARSAATLSDFLQSKGGKATLPLSRAQKRELLFSSCSASGLFDQSLLEKVSSQVKEDSVISSSLSMAKMAQSRPFVGGKSSSSSSGSAGASSQAGPSGYQSPLFQRSASGKRSTSSGSGGGSKRFKEGRGKVASSKSIQGFCK